MNLGRWLMASTFDLRLLTLVPSTSQRITLHYSFAPSSFGGVGGAVLFCQELYFPLVKKSKNVICLPPPSQGWSDLNPKMTCIYLPTDAQQLINPLIFSRIFI